ncbi:TatD family deoxyribonuclease [bacterium]|nr:MAG: TatD family deoxyribonuclease [bacterium]
MYFDTHLHLDYEPFFRELPTVVERMKAAGISGAVNAAINVDSSKKALSIHKKYPFVLPAAGLHPLYLKGREPLAELSALLRAGGFRAVGETGLDFWNGRENEELQRECFHFQVLLAKELRLPLLLHIRKGFYETLSVMREAGYRGPAVYHNFTGSLDMAKKALDANLYLSIGATVTYPRKENLRRVVKFIPADRLLVETDAPDLPPWSKKGELHDPADLPETVRALAEALGVSGEELAETTSSNARRLFLGEE